MTVVPAELVSEGRRPTVALIPGDVRDRYPELLRALEEAYPVHFAGSSAGDVESAAAVIVFPGGRCPDRPRVPTLILAGPGADARRASFPVELSRCVGLHRALHAQRLLERDHQRPARVTVEHGSQVLAVTEGMPIWVRHDSDGVRSEIASAVPSVAPGGGVPARSADRRPVLVAPSARALSLRGCTPHRPGVRRHAAPAS